MRKITEMSPNEISAEIKKRKMEMYPGLTMANIKVLDAIKAFHKLHGYMPSYEQIADSCGYKNKSTVYNHMMKLFDKGYLETDEPQMCPRAYRLGKV